MSSATKVRASLLAAIDEQRIARVERKPKYADRLDGFVLRVGAKWALMAQTTDGGFFDGFVAFRVRDVRRVRPDNTFETTFAKSQPEWPPRFLNDLDLTTTSGVVQGFGRDGALVGIQKDNERSAIWIGRLDGVEKRRAYLHEVRPDATWHPEPLGYKLKAITTIEVGTRYLTGLAAVAGTDPMPR